MQEPSTTDDTAPDRAFVEIQNLKLWLQSKQTELIELLQAYEPYNVAIDEFERSMSALEGVRDEYRGREAIVGKDLVLTTFFPLNLPLYSLVLFAIIPSIFSRKVFVRSPQIMQGIIQDLAELLNLQQLMPKLAIKNINRSTFLEVYAKRSDVILFTGRYENALAIQKQCPDSLFIFNGGGVNPAIVFDDADVALAAKCITEMRTFNSGQDCAGTDAIFVDRTIYDDFVLNLQQNLDALIIGNYDNTETQVGPILKQDYIVNLHTLLREEQKNILHEGSIDYESSIVTPYIISKPISEHEGGFHEFFAPIFYLLVFDDTDDLATVLRHSIVQDYSMYVTYFGSDPIVNSITNARLVHNCTINDVEQGNQEYGGYGEKANFVAFGKRRSAHPILISREVYDFYCNDGRRTLNTLSELNIQKIKAILDDDLVAPV